MDIKDIAGLEKPATELINRVSEAVGGIARPWQMKRVANAEVEVKKLHALADLEITEQRERALKRMILEEEKNQANIESVAQKALPHLEPDSKPQELDEDFVRYLFDKAKMVSNEEMQEVWAKVLAGEANRPGTFSRRAMDLVSQMSSGDAELFTRLIRNVWILGFLTPIVLQADVFRVEDGYSLTFSELSHLESIGLINFSGTDSFSTHGFKKNARVSYYGCPVDVEFEQEPGAIVVGSALLTATGHELARITEAESSRAAFEAGLKLIMDQGIAVSIPLDSKVAYLAL